MTPAEIAARLEYLRGELRAERISQGELIELQGLAEHIPAGDVELLEWAGVPEFPESRTYECALVMEVYAASPEEAAAGAQSTVEAGGISWAWSVTDRETGETTAVDTETMAAQNERS